MSPSAWPVVLLAAPLLIGLAGLAAAYPHRGYHDDVDGIEKNVRHIDGLGRARRDVAKDLEDAVRRQVEEQVRATGSGSASGKWSIQRHSEYSSDGSGVPVRATITGEAAQGGDGVVRLATDCHNCRMRIRKVGGVDQVGDSAQVQSTQSRYYSTSGNSQRGGYASGGSGYSGRSSGYTSGGSGYTSGGSGFSGGATSDRLVQSSRYGGFGETQQTQQPLRAQEAFDDLASSSRTRSSLTRASWKLSDLGYGTSDLAELVRRIDEDIRAGRFRDGKTVTTVTSSVSENGGPPVTKTETFVKDGLDLTQFPERGGAVGSTYTIGNSEVEDLLRGLQEQLRSGKTQAGKTVTTTVESSSINGAPPVVKKQTFVRDGFDASAVDLDAARERFEANSARLNAEAANLASSGAKRTSYSTHTSWASGGYGPARGPVDHLGGGHLVAPSYSTRTVDSLGGGHLLRETGGHGSYSQGSTAKDTRRVDSLGGGHLLRETSVQSALPVQPATETLSVSQMPGYRKEAPTEDATYAGAAGTSKYYSTFQSSSSYGGGAVADGGLQQQQTVQPSGPAAPDSASAASSADGRVTSSSYRKVVSYSSSVGERDLDHHSVVRDLPQPASGDVQRTLATNQAFIHAEQQGGSRIPEAASGSYFSSAHQRAVSGSHNEGLGVVVPARGTTASSSGRAEWASAQETRDSEYPPLSSPHGPATSSGSSQGSYSSTHNSYAGGSSLQSAAAGPSPDAAPNRGGKLSVSLMDIGILPSSHQQQQQQQVGSSYGNRYSSSSYGSNYSSRQVESSSPVTGYSSSWGSSSYSQQAPAKVSAYSASHGVARDQRVTQGHAGPDCDQGIKI